LRQTVKIAVDVGLAMGQGSPEADGDLDDDRHPSAPPELHLVPARRQILTIIVSVIVPAHG
jgi:hypothetical protein